MRKTPEKEKIIKMLDIVKAGIEHNLDKLEGTEAIEQELLGERNAYDAIIQFLKTGEPAYLTTFSNYQQKRMIREIWEGEIK